jgi:hypothetical protein
VVSGERGAQSCLKSEGMMQPHARCRQMTALVHVEKSHNSWVELRSLYRDALGGWGE